MKVQKSSNINISEILKANTVKKLRATMKRKKIDLNNTRDENGDTLLTYAIKNENYEKIELLLDAGCNPNVPSFQEPKALQDILGKNDIEISKPSPLMLAILSESEDGYDVIDLLIEKGADVNYIDEDSGIAPIHLAAYCGEIEILKSLVKNGANVNLIAGQNAPGRNLAEFTGNITPILVATLALNKSEAGKTLKFLVDNGADINLNANSPFDIAQILSKLAVGDRSLTNKTIKNMLDEHFSKMENSYIQKVLEQSSNESTDELIQKILSPDGDFKTTNELVTYLGHLNSWTQKVTAREDAERSSVRVEGWFGLKQINMKIRNMIDLLKEIEKGEIDCQKEFSETKEVIVQKLRNEIANQIKVYYTDLHSLTLSDLKDPGLKFKMKNPVLEKWCESIDKLKAGEGFPISAGTSDHSIYLEFKKQTDGNVSLVIYNLGGGSEPHLRDLNNKVYPYIVKDLPGDLFKNHNYLGMNYLSDIINAGNFPCYDHETGEVSSEFANVYEQPYLLDGNMPKGDDLKEYTAMVEQTAGNCSVKNNLCSTKNRFKNDKLYKYLKDFEISAIRTKIDMSDKLYSFKELNKDLKKLQLIINLSYEKGSENITEKLFFKFISKRADKIEEALMNEKGERIAEVIDKMKDSKALEFYLQNNPRFIPFLYKIGEDFNNNKLKQMAEEFSKDYEVTLTKDSPRKNEAAKVKETMLAKRGTAKQNLTK